MKSRRKHPKSPKRTEAGKLPPVNPPASLSPRRQWAFRLIAAIGLPLLLLGALEMSLRLAGYGFPTGFFQKIQVNGKDYLVDNQQFTLRFFPPQLQRWPSPVMFAAQKPTNTFRIFVLGESAARGEPEPPYAASRYLQTLLNERFPKTHFEVINLGITAIDSHVILPIARDCARAGGDLWIIYMGNNEMVGPFGAATVFGEKAPPLGFVRLNLAIQKTRIGQLLVDLSRRFHARNTPAAWSGMDMFLGNQLRADDPRRETVYQNYEHNLDDIVQAGLNSGAKILLSTVGVNLKDCPPFASLINSNLPAADRARFAELFAAGCTNQARTQYDLAIQNFALAAKLDPLYPELQYRWAECLLAQNHAADARQHFQTACDDDALPFRADSRINQAIQKLGEKLDGRRLKLVDAAAALAASETNGISGRENFFEHVHLTFDGNYRLARAWADAATQLLPPGMVSAARTNVWASQPACERWLGMTDWQRRSVLEIVIDRLQKPPLSGQLNNAERIRLLNQEADALQARLNPTTAAQAAEIYQAAIEHSPGDYWPVENFAEFLEATGNLKMAAETWQHECELLPHDPDSFYEYGRLLNALHQWPQAEAALNRAVAMRPRLAGAWFELGGVHLAAQKYETALEDYRRACQLDPATAMYRALQGKALSQLDRHNDAIQAYRRALAMQPDLWEAHYGLADELAATAQYLEAEKQYALAINLQPNLGITHLKRGVMLARLGRLDDAVLEFQATLSLDPGNQEAQSHLRDIARWRAQHHS